MRTKLAISQSNYIPWKGYFDLIASVSTFVIYDDMQYTKNDWRNRNKIMTPNGSQWLTIPVDTGGKFGQKISEVKINNRPWQKKHWKTISQNYSKSPFFNDYKSLFETLYLDSHYERLSDVNYSFIKVICEILGITTKLVWSNELILHGERNERLVNICKQLDSKVYVSAPAAKDYLQIDNFSQNNIEVEWFNYDGYKEYQQIGSEFCHNVSVLDLIFNMGPDARSYLRY
ncbi:WbqC family protein [Vibrio amylolyticus]|uniref:WbqC family protein n=1 Tax=Vibrio amylolyticus TaxID=2847292 RepID=UPI003551F6AD